jgi:hypothetical protein
VLELAKTLSVSGNFNINPPPAHTSLGPKHTKSKALDTNTPNPLASLQSGVEPPILPPGTFTTTPSLPSIRPTYEQALELELALQAKQKALDECSDMIDAAVDELQMMAKAGERFWRDVRELKKGKDGRGQWAVVPRPDFGKVLGEGEEARDVIVPYPVDEGEWIRL